MPPGPTRGFPRWSGRARFADDRRHDMARAHQPALASPGTAAWATVTIDG